MAVTIVLTPVLQKAEKRRFYQNIGGYNKGTIILKNSVSIRRIQFKCIFVRLEKALMQGKKITRNARGTIYPIDSTYMDKILSFFIWLNRFTH